MWNKGLMKRAQVTVLFVALSFSVGWGIGGIGYSNPLPTGLVDAPTQSEIAQRAHLLRHMLLARQAPSRRSEFDRGFVGAGSSALDITVDYTKSLLANTTSVRGIVDGQSVDKP